MSLTTFCGNIFLTYKSGFPILTSNESKVLSKNLIKQTNLQQHLLLVGGLALHRRAGQDCGGAQEMEADGYGV